MSATVFLTSSPTGALDGSIPVNGLDDRNDFVKYLREVWPERASVLMITAFPTLYHQDDQMLSFFHDVFEMRGFSISQMDILDYRRPGISREELFAYDVIILGGGHVPTQNAYFKELDLRNKIAGFEGIVIGISAGSMNSADLVYVQPEEPGESVPEFVRFLPGLNLTKRNILPHYQMVKDNYLDGRRLFEDITYADSFGQNFLVLPDGSYLMIKDGVETVKGEAWEIRDGQLFHL